MHKREPTTKGLRGIEQLNTLLSFPLSRHWRFCSGEASHSIYNAVHNIHPVKQRVTVDSFISQTVHLSKIAQI